MATLYQKKDYTQGFLREKIREKRKGGKSYEDIKSELGIGSDRTRKCNMRCPLIRKYVV